MKWIALMPVILLLAACCCNNTALVEYRQVSVVPASYVSVTPGYVSVAPAYQTIRVYNDYPVDVTTTAVEYY